MKKKVVFLILTLLLLVCCSGALAEHVHDIYLNVLADFPETAPMDEMNRPKDFTVQLYSSQVPYSCTIGMCDLNGSTTISMSSMTFTFAGYEAASVLAACETKGSYRFDGPTVEVMIDNVLYTTKPYIYLAANALGHDWSNKDGVCARKNCSKVCDHSLGSSPYRVLRSDSAGPAEPTIPPEYPGDGDNHHFPSCTRSAVCDICGKTLSALGHNWSNKDGVCARSGCGAVCDHTASKAQPTCEQSAVCDICSATILPLGHDWSNKDGVCARSGCGAVCGHTASEAQPTCEQSAACDICGKTLAALGHDDHAEVTPPSCGQKGFTTYTCTRCSRSYTADETPALSHVYGEWNPEGDGASSARCMRCKHKAKADCEMLSFTLNPSGETAEAVTFALCPVCGAVTTGQRLTLVKDAKSAQAPAGTLAVRMGEAADDVQVLTIATECAGHLLQPAETMTVSLPASLVQGLTLSLLAADGTETPLAYTVEGETISFTLHFTDADGQPISAQTIRLKPEG